MIAHRLFQIDLGRIFDFFRKISRAPTHPRTIVKPCEFDVADLYRGPVVAVSDAGDISVSLDEKLRQAYFWIVNNAIIRPHYDIEYNDGPPQAFAVGDSKRMLTLPSSQSYSSYVLLPLLTFAIRPKCLCIGGPGRGKTASAMFYMRIYEHLWTLDRGELAGAGVTDAIDTGAWLGARLGRAYAGDWMAGSARFAALVLPYLVEESMRLDSLRCLHDTEGAATGCVPSAVHEVEPGEDDLVHPRDDPRVIGDDVNPAPSGLPTSSAPAQTPEPFEYGEILKAAGIMLDNHQIAMRYYREPAQPHLIPFPVRLTKAAAEPLIAAVESWDIGEPLDRIDWLHSLTVSPRPIPGLTMVRAAMKPNLGASAHRRRSTSTCTSTVQARWTRE